MISVSWFVDHVALGFCALGLLLVATCLLTWLDPIVRAGQVPALLAMAGWASMAVIPLLASLFSEAEPAVAVAWGIAGMYALSILGTLGRPLLIFSDLLEEAESEGARLAASDWRRSRIGQVVLLVGITAGVVLVMA